MRREVFRPDAFIVRKRTLRREIPAEAYDALRNELICEFDRRAFELLQCRVPARLPGIGNHEVYQ